MIDRKIEQVREAFAGALVRWFRVHGRRLPWRQEYDPYHVWLSEIMLQQTQMERGIRYFHRWLNRFPDIQAVAEASLDEILKYWEGLGYYARARNLHKAAKIMVGSHDGRVPRSHDQLLGLPGVGSYTAAAVASIAYNCDVAVADANVERVYARVFDIDTPIKEKRSQLLLNHIAREMLPPGEARDYNQALMDLGAMICTPKKPDCGNCPVRTFCSAYLGDFVDDRPIKTRPPKIIPIDMATGLLIRQGAIFIQQRHDDDIWGGMWEFPGGRLKENEAPAAAVVREYREETGFSVEVCRQVTTVIHHYTKYKVTLHCFLCRMRGESAVPELRAAQKYHWVHPRHLERYALPAGHRKFIDYLRSEWPEAIQQECSPP